MSDMGSAAIEHVKLFSEEHPRLTNRVKWTVKILGFIRVAAEAYDSIRNRKSFGNSHTPEEKDDPMESDFVEPSNDDSDYESDATEKRNYPDERASPEEHTVKKHIQRYGKDKIPKEVGPYKRGGKK